MIENLTPISYVAVSILFILSLGGLASQKKAKAGNVLGMIGMAIALSATFLDTTNFHGYGTFWIAVIPAALIGFYVASKVAMTQMPQLVAALHSFVGLAAVLVGIAKFLKEGDVPAFNKEQVILDIETFLGVFIGAVTFTGSVVAFGKLQGTISGNPLILFGWGRHVINASAVGTSVLAMLIYIGVWHSIETRLVMLIINTLLAFFVGWHLVMAIGGADMPVVVSMLNSYSGWATSAAGFMLDNDAMIVTGALVGSSGAILSYIMCEAMNRHFLAVILGGFGGEVAAPVAHAAGEEKKEVGVINAKETVDRLMEAKTVVIVPGYGLAVARGQHAIASIAESLRAMGKLVRFAIHPVAGRLPGHMNVLLAEANVPYDIVLSMEEINSDMPETDVSIVVGANDIVNPIALTDPTSPIAGMPIIETFKTKLCIVNKRSMASGYAGVDNPLFYYENTKMLFGDARKAFEEVLSELQKRRAEMKESLTEKNTEKTALMADAVERITSQDLPPVFSVIGVVREVTPQERMVSITPQTALALRKKGFGIIVESGAGLGASMPDSEYEKVLCQVVPDAKQVYNAANVIIKVQPPVASHPTLHTSEVSLLREGQTLISFLYPARNQELVGQLVAGKVTALAMDMVPRITRAQKLDALSSLSNLAGYRSVIEASHAFGRVFTGQITAAGKMPPASVFIIGAGVAGLAAIGTAKNLGAVVKAFDTRRSVKEQIESMGGEFLPCPIDEDAEDANGYAKQISDAFIKAELELFARTCPVSDIVITTAAIPGRKAPILITEDMVSSMRPGSVIVDLAAGTGGNCEVTRVGETYSYKGVTIVGNTDLVARMAPQASQLYSQNIINLLDMLVDQKEKRFVVNESDEIVRQMCVSKGGASLFPPPKLAVSAAPAAKKKPPPPVALSSETKKETGYTTKSYIYLGSVMLLLVAMIWFVPSGFISHFMDFVLAIIVGFHVIWSVTPALHTPLMSVTNAISGIIAVGGMLLLSSFSDFSVHAILGIIATMLASINICGGFFVSYRMLLMFHD